MVTQAFMGNECEVCIFGLSPGFLFRLPSLPIHLPLWLCKRGRSSLKHTTHNHRCLRLRLHSRALCRRNLELGFTVVNCKDGDTHGHRLPLRRHCGSASSYVLPRLWGVSLYLRSPQRHHLWSPYSASESSFHSWSTKLETNDDFVWQR
jgi:hypothetical protein